MRGVGGDDTALNNTLSGISSDRDLKKERKKNLGIIGKRYFGIWSSIKTVGIWFNMFRERKKEEF